MRPARSGRTEGTADAESAEKGAADAESAEQGAADAESAAPVAYSRTTTVST